MTDGKLYLLAEFLVKPEVLEETKAIFAGLLPAVLEEEGCEAMHTTSVEGEPNRLVFFEIFSSEEAHRFHMAQTYTHQLAGDLEGKLLGPMKMTRLEGFQAAESPASGRAWMSWRLTLQARLSRREDERAACQVACEGCEEGEDLFGGMEP